MKIYEISNQVAQVLSDISGTPINRRDLATSIGTAAAQLVKPNWVKKLSADDKAYRNDFIKAIKDEKYWQKSIDITNSKGEIKTLTISLATRKNNFLEVFFSIDHDFIKPKHKKHIQDPKLGYSVLKLVIRELLRILYTVRPENVKFSALLVDSTGLTHSQGKSRADLYDRLVSDATPYLQQLGYSVNITRKTEEIEWVITRK